MEKKVRFYKFSDIREFHFATLRILLRKLLSQTDLKVVPPQIPERNVPKAMSVLTGSGVEAIGNEIFDAECMKLMNEYFYGVRIFPGQDPTHVYVGWVTSQYHLHTKDFNLSRVRKSSVAIIDEYDRLVEQYVSL